MPEDIFGRNMPEDHIFGHHDMTSEGHFCPYTFIIAMWQINQGWTVSSTGILGPFIQSDTVACFDKIGDIVDSDQVPQIPFSLFSFSHIKGYLRA